MNKKIGLLTLPLIANYGGILQCLALAHTLKKMGGDVTLIDIRPKNKLLRRVVLYVLARVPFQNIKGVREKHIKEIQNKKTISKYISKKTQKIETASKLKEEIKNFNPDAVIVGSDQVWRYEYINNDMYSAYFLDFDEVIPFRKISYAASFGVDTWNHEGKREVTQELLEKFHSISVREKSGLAICREEFAINDVTHVLDPTMLDLNFYEEFLNDVPDNDRHEYLLQYILDEKKSSDIISHIIKGDLNLTHQIDINNSNKNYSIEEWVSAFKYAKYIVTDSFHGVVFSILFNKPFIAIGNKSRGLSRFTSLLDTLELSDRLIFPEDILNNRVLTGLLDSDIDYCKVNNIVAEWRRKSLDFLSNSLK